MALETLDSKDFDEIIYDKAEPSLVLFSRKSCSVCQGVVPVLEALQGEYIDRFNFYYVDAEKEKNLAVRFSLRGVPQILFFNDGEYEGKLIGRVEEEQVQEKIEEILKS